MSDLIKRDDAITVLYRNTPFDAKGIALLDKCESEINAIPSADTDISEYSDRLWKNAYERGKADRPQGEWIAVDSYSAFGGSEEQWNAHGNPIAYHYCSNCKSQTRVDEFGEEMLTDFCPNCGARMKGADDE